MWSVFGAGFLVSLRHRCDATLVSFQPASIFPSQGSMLNQVRAYRPHRCLPPCRVFSIQPLRNSFSRAAYSVDLLFQDLFFIMDHAIDKSPLFRPLYWERRSISSLVACEVRVKKFSCLMMSCRSMTKDAHFSRPLLLYRDSAKIFTCVCIALRFGRQTGRRAI